MEKKFNETHIGNLNDMVDCLRSAKEHLEFLQDGVVVLVLGNTGCGKSTMLSSLVYGPQNLVLKPDPKNNKRKVIDKDKGLTGFKIGH